MAVSTDTIQMLLRQRQDLREALIDLHQEISTLDATSLNLVNKNIKAQTATDAALVAAEAAAEKAAAPVAAPVTAPVTAPAATPVAAPAPTPTQTAAASVAPAAAAPAAVTSPAPAADPTDKPVEQSVPSPPSPTVDDDLARLLPRARALSGYFLEHPAATSAADLHALDTAITAAAAATGPADKTIAYHSLQAAYRKVASESHVGFGINGTTLTDSRLGARLLWAVPMAIAALVLAVFPLILLARTLANRMFTADFAADLTWTFDAIAAFLWGAVGALTLLALNVALLIRRCQFDAAIHQSPALRAGLGGLTGTLCFLLLQIWVSENTVRLEFAIDLAAFAAGLLSAILFAGLHRLFNGVIFHIEPVPKAGLEAPDATGAVKK